MKRPLQVTVMMDEGCVPADDGDFTRDDQPPSTERHVITALRELGHRVGILPVGHELDPILRQLAEPPDLIFNLTEQFGNDRRMDKNLVALLELMHLRYTGTGPTGLMLCRDKGLCKQLLSLHRIRVPDFFVLPPGRPPRPPRRIQYPLIVKPVYEDASDGISMASIVRNDDELAQRARMVHERFQQVAIAEEYVAGRELYISILGNRRLSALPAREIRFGANGQGGPEIATSRVKWDNDYRDKWKIEYCLAELPQPLAARVGRICKKVYRLLQLRDFGRIDLRLTDDGKIVILEVNHNPDIAYGEEVAEAAAKVGISYDRLIDRIVWLAMRRYEST